MDVSEGSSTSIPSAGPGFLSKPFGLRYALLAPENGDGAHEGGGGADDAESPPADDEALTEIDLADQMAARMGELTSEADPDAVTTAKEKATEKGKQAAPDSKQKPADKGEAKDGSAKLEGDAGAEKVESESAVVPKAVFDARIGKLSSQKRELTTKLTASDLELRKVSAALVIAREELEHAMTSWSDGVAFDEKDALLRDHGVRDRARKALDTVGREHRADVAKQTQAEKRAELEVTVEQELDEAVAAFDLVPRGALVSAARLKENHAKSYLEVAEALQEELETKVLAKNGVAKPNGGVAPPVKEKAKTPRTVRSGSHGNAAMSVKADLESMDAFFEAQLAKSQD